MQKTVMWIRLITKAHMGKKSTWVLLAVSLVFFFLLKGMTIPATDVNVVLLYSDDAGAYGNQIVEDLENCESVFDFVKVDTKEQLMQGVYKGTALCGFLFPFDFSKSMNQGVQEETVTYVCAAPTSKGNIAKETVYRNMFYTYSDCLLAEHAEQLAEDNADSFLTDVQARNQEYLESDELFRIETVEIDNEEGEASEFDAFPTYPLPGLIALLIFVSMLLTRGDNMETGKRQLYVAMLPSERVHFSFLQYLVVGMMTGIIGFLYFLIGTKGQYGIRDVVVLFIYIVFCSAWMLVFERIFQKESSYYAWVTTLVLINAIVAPVFVNIDMYIPAMTVVRNIFPVGFYINIYEILH